MLSISVAASARRSTQLLGTESMPQQHIPTLRDLTWRLPALLVILAFVISVVYAAALGIVKPLSLLTLFGGVLVAVLAAAFVAIGVFALADPWVWGTVERASNRVITRVFRLPAVSTGVEGLIGSRGIVVDGFDRSGADPYRGRVRVAGESWNAVVSLNSPKVSIGDTVIVRAVNGLMLDVESSEPGPSEQR